MIGFPLRTCIIIICVNQLRVCSFQLWSRHDQRGLRRAENSEETDKVNQIRLKTIEANKVDTKLTKTTDVETVDSAERGDAPKNLEAIIDLSIPADALGKMVKNSQSSVEESEEADEGAVVEKISSKKPSAELFSKQMIQNSGVKHIAKINDNDITINDIEEWDENNRQNDNEKLLIKAKKSQVTSSKQNAVNVEDEDDDDDDKASEWTDVGIKVNAQIINAKTKGLYE